MATATTPSGGTSTASFIYNALGERVQLVAPTYTYNYPFDAFGKEIGIHNSSSGWGHYTVEMAGRRIFLSVSATRWLFHPNVVGSSTMVTDQTGAVVQDATYYPWGQLWQSPGSFGGNWNFAAFGVLEPTTNLSPTPFRRYSSTQGRWLSPDPLGGDVTNPQSLNRYAYALNSPTNLVDPLGLDPFAPVGCDPEDYHNCSPCDIFEMEACPPGCDPFFGCTPGGPLPRPFPGGGGGGASSSGRLGQNLPSGIPPGCTVDNEGTISCPGAGFPWWPLFGLGGLAALALPQNPQAPAKLTGCQARVQNALQNQLDGNGNVNSVVSSNLSGGHFDIQFNVISSSD